MTAIPPEDDTGSPLLICDDCGRACTVEQSVPSGWQALWTFAVDAGWRGRDRPVGPHVCDGCVSPPGVRPAADVGRTTGDTGEG
ncbi:hypothetical protein ACQPW3_28110 [Actinosynnema sp. CA-248983]